MKEEIWIKIPYSNEYEVSNFGGFRHLFINRYDINTGTINKIPKITYPKCQTRQRGYKCIRIYKNHTEYNLYTLHRVIAEVFIPDKTTFKSMPYEDRNSIDLNTLQVNHKDENKSNNRVDNLEWCTLAYNLNYSKAKEIEQYNLNGDFIKRWNSIIDASRKLNISKGNICSCCRGNYKTAGGYVWKYADKLN